MTNLSQQLCKICGIEPKCINCAGVECLFKKYELLKIQNQQQYMEFKNKEINYEEQIRQL